MGGGMALMLFDGLVWKIAQVALQHLLEAVIFRLLFWLLSKFFKAARTDDAEGEETATNTSGQAFATYGIPTLALVAIFATKQVAAHVLEVCSVRARMQLPTTQGSLFSALFVSALGRILFETTRSCFI